MSEASPQSRVPTHRAELKGRLNDTLYQFYERTKLSYRAQNCLLNNCLDLKTVGDLAKLTDSELLYIRNLGKLTLLEIRTAVRQYLDGHDVCPHCGTLIVAEKSYDKGSQQVAS